MAENKQISDFVFSLTDEIMLKKLQILCKSFPSNYGLDSSLVISINQRCLEVTKISEFVKTAVDKENEEMRKQIIDLTEMVESLKKQLAKVQSVK